MAGAKSKYHPSIINRINDFFSLDEPSFTEVRKLNGNIQLVPRILPTYCRFAFQEGISRRTLYNWANQKNTAGELSYPDFNFAYQRAKNVQCAILIEAGVVGAYKSSFAIRIMKNVHGWKDNPNEQPRSHTTIDLDKIDEDVRKAEMAELLQLSAMKDI